MKNTIYNSKDNKKYTEYSGPLTETIKRVLEDGKIPLTSSQLIRKVVDAKNGTDYEKNFWWEKPLTPSNFLIYKPNGDLKVPLNYSTDILKKIKEGILDDGGIMISNKEYEETLGTIIRGADKLRLDYWQSSPNNEYESNIDPFWNSISNDTKILKDYSKIIYENKKKDFLAMGVDLFPFGRDFPIVRAFNIQAVRDGANIDGWTDFTNTECKIIGMSN